MSFKQNLGNFKSEFDTKLDQFLEKKISESKEYNPVIVQNLEYIADLLKAGGKRFRPAMAYFGYKLINEAENPKVWSIGIALELFHCFALVHDDIIDKSLVRRNSPTIEALYQTQFQKTHPGLDYKHYAMSAAILGGDLAFVLANQIMAKDLGSSDNLELQNLYYTMQFELVAGQMDDCFGVGLSDLDALDQSRIISMLKTKSGNYSIQKPLLMGAMLAGASQAQLEVLKSCGEKLGLVFQIKDDILGIFGLSEEIGKSNTSDILEGKKTLLMAKAYNLASSEQKLEFKKILGNPEASQSQIDWLKDYIATSGVVEELEKYCFDLILSAKEELSQAFDLENPALQFLLELADYLYQRTS
jgi:geranylgeranyl diphosphate synthase type I